MRLHKFNLPRRRPGRLPRRPDSLLPSKVISGGWQPLLKSQRYQPCSVLPSTYTSTTLSRIHCQHRSSTAVHSCTLNTAFRVYCTSTPTSTPTPTSTLTATPTPSPDSSSSPFPFEHDGTGGPPPHMMEPPPMVIDTTSPMAVFIDTHFEVPDGPMIICFAVINLENEATFKEYIERIQAETNEMRKVSGGDPLLVGEQHGKEPDFYLDVPKLSSKEEFIEHGTMTYIPEPGVVLRGGKRKPGHSEGMELLDNIRDKLELVWTYEVSSRELSECAAEGYSRDVVFTNSVNKALANMLDMWNAMSSRHFNGKLLIGSNSKSAFKNIKKSMKKKKMREYVNSVELSPSEFVAEKEMMNVMSGFNDEEWLQDQGSENWNNESEYEYQFDY